jgi:hypothetical protein
VLPLGMFFLGWSDADVAQFADSLSNIVFWLLSIGKRPTCPVLD